MILYKYKGVEENMKKRKMLFAMILGICILTLVGCGKEQIPDDGTQSNNPSEAPEQKVTIIDVNSKTRPYAVMINCHNEALPQAGLDQAYIVYELMVEGGITRMMALFKDKDIAKIGSVRSARIQYLDYVYENDAIYVHAGGAPDALDRIASERISDINPDGVYGMRDKSLNRSWEHTLFTSTNHLKGAVTEKNIRTTTDSTNLLKYSVEELDLSKYSTAKKVNDLSIRYSDYRTSIYKYDEANKTYLRSMNNTKNTDLVTGKQYTVKNIIAYAVPYTGYSIGGYSAYRKIDNVGSGDGYYITNGYAVPITWTKNSHNGKTVYKIKETNEELIVNDGNTYIQIYPTSGNLTMN